MQSKTDIETWYRSEDPWQYKNNPDDTRRKQVILNELKQIKSHYLKALDIGAGEGWITKDLPADDIYAIEWSDEAAKRLPEPIKRVFKPEGEYDLIIATGVFYDQYDWQQMHQWILEHSVGIVLTSNIKSWEHPLPKKPMKEMEFPYREYNQHLCLYDFSTT